MKNILAILLYILTTSGTSCQQTYEHNKPIELRFAHDIVINGENIEGGSVPCIKLSHCSRIRITNCKLMNSSTYGIYLSQCSDIQVDHNYITKVSTGVYAEDCPDGQIRVTDNEMLNMIGEPYHKDFVQYNRVNGANNKICNNRLENIFGQSNPEDAINLYKCNGLENDPIYIANNFIRGGGPSETGSGITIGDKGGSNQLAENNVLVNTGYIGMQVAGGTNIKIINNTIYSRAFPWSHLGLGYGNYSGQPSNNVTITGNKVNWTSGWPRDQLNGSSSRKFHSSYHKADLEKPKGWDDNVLDAAIDSTILPKKLLRRH